MPFVTVKRLGLITSLTSLEVSLRNHIAAIEELRITSDKVFVSFPAEIPRDTDFWREPIIEMCFSDSEERTDGVKKQALSCACEVLYNWLLAKNVRVREVRETCITINQETQYVKYAGLSRDDYKGA